MKNGRNIQQLTEEVTRQASARKDLVARTEAIEFVYKSETPWPNEKPGRPVVLRVNSHGEFGINELAHRQVGEHLSIPAQFYDRLKAQHPSLLADTVNTLMPKEQKRLVRTLDGNARAFLSDRYRPIDNIDLLNNLLPVLMERPDVQFASAEVTEKKLYLKIVSRELEGEVKQGDVVRMGIIISNSEVGLGSVLIAPFSDRLVCSNGMIHTNFGKRRSHIGKAQEGEGEAWEFYTDETRKADDTAFFLKVRDTLKATLSGDVLKAVLEDMRDAAGEKIEGDPSQMVEVVAAQNALNESERISVLQNLIKGADLSRWGLANAITLTAQDSPSYDRASELEQIGGNVVSRPLPTNNEVQAVSVRRRPRRQLAAVA